MSAGEIVSAKIECKADIDNVTKEYMEIVEGEIGRYGAANLLLTDQAEVRSYHEKRITFCCNKWKGTLDSAFGESAVAAIRDITMDRFVEYIKFTLDTPMCQDPDLE